VSEAILELRDVHVQHRISGDKLFAKDTVYALTGADLAVSAGETVGIVGESGCGKSTLAKAIVGLQQPTSGEVLFHGESLWAMSASARRTRFGRNVGMVFQDPSTALNRRLPVKSILRDPLTVHGIGDARQRTARVAELMDLVGLPSSAADALPAQLSGGQRQRVAIARALALQPSVLVADEPTSALDVSVRAQILNLLLELKAEFDLAMIFISHDIQTVRRMSDRIVTMYLGRIVEVAPAAAVPADVRHPYTEALLSATPSLVEDVEPITLEGPVPSAVHPPSGCPFRTRCWKATEQCATELPPVTRFQTVPLHTARCYHPVGATEPLAIGGAA
jgi:peptide/nickel transport system ATP-binding protein